MKIFRLLCAFAVAFAPSVAATDATQAVAFTRRAHPLPVKGKVPSPRTLGMALSVPRGGDATTVAKLFTRWNLLPALLLRSAPSKGAHKLFNLDPTPLREWMADFLGHGLVSLFIFFHCLLDRSLDVNHALAYSMIVYIMSNLRHILDDKAVGVGYKKEGFAFFTLVHIAMVYTVLSGHKWANILVKFELFANLASVPTFLFVPQTAAKLWGHEEPIDDGSVAILRAIGYMVAAHHGAAALMLFLDKSAVEVVGFAALLGILQGIDALLVSKECDKLGTAKGRVLLTMALNAVVSYMILK